MLHMESPYMLQEGHRFSLLSHLKYLLNLQTHPAASLYHLLHFEKQNTLAVFNQQTIALKKVTLV